MNIETSLDWNKCETYFLDRAVGLRHRDDIRRMVNNVHDIVTDLSRAEVMKRRGVSNNANALVTKINEEIESLEEYLVIAKLIG